MESFTDVALAARLEGLAAADLAGLAEAAAGLGTGTPSESIEVGGGVACYLEPGSPANGAVGLGFDGAVTQEQIALVETFFLERGEVPTITVCPLAHASLAGALSERGWIAGTCENVLVRALDAEESFAPHPDGLAFREATSRSDLNRWALTAARGFSAPDEPTPAEIALATAATRRTGARFFFGLVSGILAGTGQLDIAGDIAWLSADTTLPGFRRLGIQSALQRIRLELGTDAGCRLAVTESVPGSASQRNQERIGFRVAYTRVDAVYPMPSGAGSQNRSSQ